MRQVLDDITNTVHVVGTSSSPTVSAHDGTLLKHLAHKTSSGVRRPKLLRQTSLLAFAAARQSPTPTIPAASTSSSPPPPLTSSSGASHTDAVNEGEYSSTPDLVPDLGCDISDNDEEDEAEAHLSSSLHKRKKRARFEQTERDVHDDDFDSQKARPVTRDAAFLSRQEQAKARNRANLFGSARRQTHGTALLRLAEYSRSNPDPQLAPRFTDLKRSKHLQSFVSHYEKDVYRCYSQRDYRDNAPPFACAFSNAAKKGGRKILAVADEEGKISLIDTQHKAERGYIHATYFEPHQNAVFDLSWSADDRWIATGSGDQTAVITDVETRSRLFHLKTHVCSVKQIVFDPFNPNLLATASRDGSIGIWDVRSKPNKGSLSTVNHIRYAHDTYAKSRKSKEAARSVTRSVTSLVYLPHQEHVLASGGSADGVVKLWDLRKTFSKRINPPYIEESQDFTPASSFDIAGPPSSSGGLLSSSCASTASSGSTKQSRNHGISSMCLAPDGSTLYALSTNSRFYAHDTNYLSRPLSAPMHTFSSPSFVSSGSFYVRLAISPDGRYMACGSSGAGFQTSVFDLHRHSARTIYGETTEAQVALKGHNQEVGGIDWAQDALATCGDDALVRVWRLNAEIARQADWYPRGTARYNYDGMWRPLRDEPVRNIFSP